MTCSLHKRCVIWEKKNFFYFRKNPRNKEQSSCAPITFRNALAGLVFKRDRRTHRLHVSFVCGVVLHTGHPSAVVPAPLYQSFTQSGDRSELSNNAPPTYRASQCFTLIADMAPNASDSNADVLSDEFGFQPGNVVISGFSCRLPECDSVDELRRKLYASEDMVNGDPTRWPTGTSAEIVET